MRPRFDDWPQRMEAAILARRDLPRTWGKNDCAAFPAAVIEAMTGDDFFAPFRGKYSTGLGAVRAVKEAGFETLADYAAANAEEIPVRKAARGDLVFYESGHGGIGVLAIVEGEIAYTAGDTRADRLRTFDAGRAFRIGGE